MADLPIPAALKASARDFYFSNKAKNAAEKKAEAERKILFTAMDAAGIEDFTFETTDPDNGNKVRLKVDVGTPTGEVIDVALLKDLVDAETFFLIVTASKKAVLEHSTEEVCVKATRTKAGKRNVSVKPAA